MDAKIIARYNLACLKHVILARKQVQLVVERSALLHVHNHWGQIDGQRWSCRAKALDITRHSGKHRRAMSMMRLGKQKSEVAREKYIESYKIEVMLNYCSHDFFTSSCLSWEIGF